MVARTPWGDVFDEFTARTVPYGYKDANGSEARRQKEGATLDKLTYPDEDGALMGRHLLPVRPEYLKTRVEKWNEYYNSKLRIIEGEIRDLHVRRGPFWHPFMLIGTAVFAFAVFLAVLAVDYAVLSEFWARVYSNEFGEVPPDFAASVIIKSLQVVVAALAFHFFYQSLNREGRKIFVYFVFVVTLLFLLGLGFLNAGTSLPEGSDLAVGSASDDQAREDREILEALGLADEAGAPAAEETPEDAERRRAEEVQRQQDEDRRRSVARLYDGTWFATLALLFVAVTSVAAMTLHVALRALSGLFGRIDNEHYDRSIMNKRDMGLRLLRARRAREWLRSEETRVQLMKHCLAAFETGYIFGAYNPDMGKGKKSDIAQRREMPGGPDDGPTEQSRELIRIEEMSASVVEVRNLLDGEHFHLVVDTPDAESFVEQDNEDELKRQQYARRQWKAPKPESEGEAKDEKKD